MQADLAGVDRRSWRGLWYAVLWLTLMSLALVAGQFLVGVLVAARRGAGERLAPEEVMALFADGDTVGLAFVVSESLVLAAILVILRYRLRQPVLRWLAVVRPDARSLLLWCCAAAGLIGLSVVTAEFLDRPVPEWAVRAYETADNLVLFWIGCVVFASLGEELMFRGCILRSIMDSRAGAVAAVLGSALLWAAIHLQYDLYDMAWLFLFGLLLGASRIVSGSILVPMAMHALWNATSLVLLGWYTASPAV